VAARRNFTRRQFIGHSTSCAAHLGLMAAASPLWARDRWTSQTRFPVDASEPWGRLERVAEGIWALVSTPLQDRTTLCNGGIVAGRSGVVVIEGLASDAGSIWLSAQAERLTGRRPTHVVLTHYHSDHTGGLEGAVVAAADVRVFATEATRDFAAERNRGAALDVLEGAVLLEGRRPSEIDLGDRSLLVVPRRGHTDSDLTFEIPEESVVFGGDLVWNGMFPNYVDAVPSRLSQAVRMLRATDATTYVPGHGPLADARALDAYIGLLDHVEEAARDAIRRGSTAQEAGAAYRLPGALENWTLFSPGYFTLAIEKWMQELSA
jgi:glyoxylase-like metal-dependent hydrolase (beta-lactamase superfamily II)